MRPLKGHDPPSWTPGQTVMESEGQSPCCGSTSRVCLANRWFQGGAEGGHDPPSWTPSQADAEMGAKDTPPFRQFDILMG